MKSKDFENLKCGNCGSQDYEIETVDKITTRNYKNSKLFMTVYSHGKRYNFHCNICGSDFEREIGGLKNVNKS